MSSQTFSFSSILTKSSLRETAQFHNQVHSTTSSKREEEKNQCHKAELGEAVISVSQNKRCNDFLSWRDKPRIN